MSGLDEVKYINEPIIDLWIPHKLKVNQSILLVVLHLNPRLQKLVSQLKIHGVSLSQEDINLKFLRSLPSEWKTHTLIWRNKANLEEHSLDDLFNSLRIYEAKVKHSSSLVSATTSVSAVCAQLPVSFHLNINSLSNAYSVNPSLNIQNEPDAHELFINELIQQKLQNEYAQPFLDIAITFDLPTVETEDSLRMRDEHLDTIPETKSDEFIKSSVENLVPNPSESEDLSDSECDVPDCDDFTTFSNLFFDADDDFSSSDNESFFDEDISKEIYSNPLFDEEIISIKINPNHFNDESDLIESLLNRDSSIISSSSKIDSLLDEFAGERILLKSSPPGIDETYCDLEEEIRLIEKLFDSFMEEIDLSFTLDAPLPTGIKEDDYDSERDMLIIEELLSNDSLSLPENESFHFNILSFPRPPAKPQDDDSKILIVKVMGDIFEQPMAPIIEDWVSDSEDESEPNDPQSFPSFVQSTKHVKPFGHSDQPIETPILKCGSSNKGFSFYAKPKTPPTPRNYAHKGYYKKHASFTKNQPQKHIVLAAVLPKSKTISVTAARPVSNVVPNIMVTKPRHAHSLKIKSNSIIRSHKTHSESSKTSNSSPNVTAAKAQVVSAAKGKKGNGYRDQKLNGGYVAFGGNLKGGKISSKGKIKTGKLDFEDVYFVKELKFNLLCVSQMCDKKNKVLFTDSECLVLSPDFKLPNESQVLLRVHRENNMYNVNLKDIVPSGDLTCPFAKATIDESN
nr:putative ribonuclease H-like domain-containing protein [Tanacetum cinerariifolium]